ncbi:hypothetical protein E3N88_40118 [Mikania micrantha]|uniref:Uncharacterized protein n=1 Tax=Mikania micrantha TaxID=192012 RepID=A0A5N6LML5_9ASTR|nr:hypothetical protein E3N88_40118 [Mikania micrantha]
MTTLVADVVFSVVVDIGGDGRRRNMKAKSAKARLSALQDKNTAWTRRCGYKGLNQKLDEIWTPLVESNPLLKDVEDVKTVSETEFRIVRNRKTKKITKMSKSKGPGGTPSANASR